MKAKYLVEHTSAQVHAMIRSTVYAGASEYEALHNQSHKALPDLQRAHDIFFTASAEEGPFYAEVDRSTFIKADGRAHYHMGQYEKALDSFDQIVDLETLSPKIPAQSERVRVEIITHATLAMLKQQQKDMELVIKLWQAGIEGATALLSEQRFGEVQNTYDMMEAVWPGEKKIKDLKELLRKKH